VDLNLVDNSVGNMLPVCRAQTGSVLGLRRRDIIGDTLSTRSSTECKSTIKPSMGGLGPTCRRRRTKYTRKSTQSKYSVLEYQAGTCRQMTRKICSNFSYPFTSFSIQYNVIQCFSENTNFRSGSLIRNHRLMLVGN